MAVVDITKDNFQAEVLAADKPVLVDFWAPWCGPCKMFAPTVHEIADEEAGRVKVAKVNIDDNQELAEKYNVMGVPTLILFKNGEPVNKSVGVQPKAAVLAMLDK